MSNVGLRLVLHSAGICTHAVCLTRDALPAGSCFTRVLITCFVLQVCTYIGLCDASASLQQDGPASRKLLHQKPDGALMQRLAAALPAKHRQRMDAVAERKQLGDSVQCQFCEMAVTYVKVSLERFYRQAQAVICCCGSGQAAGQSLRCQFCNVGVTWV